MTPPFLSSFSLGQPIWLILIPAVLLLAVVMKPLSLLSPLKPLRLAILVLIALTLAQPRMQMQDQALDLWVLVDRSASVQDRVDQSFAEWKKILEKSKPSGEDRLHFIDYASDVQPQDPHHVGGAYMGKRNLTKTKLAVDNVIARLDDDRPSRILVLTDGYSTEPLYDLGGKLARAAVPLDYRLVTQREFGDYQIVNFDLPTSMQVNEPFILRIEVEGDTDGPVPIVISRDDRVLKQTEVVLREGKGMLEFTTRIPRSGSYGFRAEIAPEQDALEGNNRSEKRIQIMGGPKVLLVTNYEDDPLLSVLAQQHYQVQIVSDSHSLQVGSLLGTETVIFNNVPAHEVPADFLKALPFYVEEQGGGFLMIGGDRSFAAGGYYKSPVDEILPVTMELKNDHRKLSVAMAIVMDRSGSMSAGVKDASGGTTTKMQLANNGAAEAINLLGYNDQICLFMVDTSATNIIPLQMIEGNRNGLKKKAMSIVSGGGGIHVFEGMNKGWIELRKSPYSTKHMILFSDARDSVREDGYEDLIERMTDAGASVSVIALGEKTDSCAALLEDIAHRGKGRIFFANDALDIPQLFAQETVAIARSAYIDADTSTLPTGQWHAISPSPMAWLPTVGAYNLSYARPQATVSLLSNDDYKAPLIAHWQRGAGRVASIAFPMGGQHSQAAREWEHYGNMSQTVLRWLNGDPLPPGLTMRHQAQGTDLQLDLFYDPDADHGLWTETFAQRAPQIVVQRDQNTPTELHWKRIAPGHYSLRQSLSEGELIKGAVRAGNHAFPFGPIMVEGNTEWKRVTERVDDLRTLSTHSGGRELVDLTTAWLRPDSLRFRDLQIPLLITLLALLIIDAFLAQTGINLTSLLKYKLLRLKPASTSPTPVSYTHLTLPTTSRV